MMKTTIEDQIWHGIQTCHANNYEGDLFILIHLEDFAKLRNAHETRCYLDIECKTYMGHLLVKTTSIELGTVFVLPKELHTKLIHK